MIKSAALGLSVSLLAVWWLLRTVNVDEVIRTFKTVDPLLILCALVLTCFSYTLRSYRWPFFFRTNAPTFFQSFQCVIIGFFMNNILPARLGEFVRAHMGGRETKQSRTLVLATIAGERLVDGLTISIIFASFFLLGANAQEIAEGREILYVAAGFAFIALATGLVLWRRHLLFRLLEGVGKRFPGQLSSFTLVRVKRFVEGLEPIFSPKKLLPIGGMSVTIWLIELSVYFFVALAFSQKMTVGGLALFLAAVNFSSLIPAAPGGLMVIEAFATAALTHIGINSEVALAMVVSQHALQIIVVGIPGLFLFIYRMHGHLPDEATDELLENDIEDSEGGVRKTASAERT